MSVYTVHVKTEDASAAEACFVREGFNWAALVFGPFWLLFHRLWWAFAGWVLVIGIANLLMYLMHLDGSASGWINGLVLLFLAFEGNQLRRIALERSGWSMVDVVSGPKLETAEHSFYLRWRGQDSSTPVNRPPAPRYSAATEVLGLFPQKGA